MGKDVARKPLTGKTKTKQKERRTRGPHTIMESAKRGGVRNDSPTMPEVPKRQKRGGDPEKKSGGGRKLV